MKLTNTMSHVLLLIFTIFPNFLSGMSYDYVYENGQNNERSFKPYVFNSGYLLNENKQGETIGGKSYTTNFDELKTPSMRYEDDVVEKRGNYIS